jgi:hypothetical protein
MNIKVKQNLIFAIIVVALSIHFKFYETINLPPQSTDLWRQADCYTIALNYYQNGFHFFKPQVHFLFTQNGYAAGEFPIIYFVSALLFKVFGVHYFLFKGLNLFIFFAGLYALFKLALRLTNDLFFSSVLSLLYFCTPVIFFYANNFLSDVSALSFNLIGMLFFVAFLEENNKNKLFIAAASFALAGLLKASASLFLVAIMCALFTELFITKKKSNFFNLLKSNKLQLFLSLTIALCFIIAWYLYAIYFNKSNQTVFFGTKAMKGWPIWENSKKDIVFNLINFKDIYLEIISLVNFIVFIISIFLIVIFKHKTDALFNKILLFLFIGFSIFIAYFWKGFQDQQYYMVNLVILPLISIILAYKIYITFVISKYFKLLLNTAAILSCFYLIYSSKNVYLCYYKGGWRHQKLNEVYYDGKLEKKLTALGIDTKQIVISLTDGTPNGTLSMLNRRGWSSFAFVYGNNIIYTKASFNSKIKMGATFLILNDTSLLSNPTIKYFAQTPLGNYKDLYFYKLPNQ